MALSRTDYDQWLTDLDSRMSVGQVQSPYEDVVDYYVAQFGNSGISPQEIGDTLYGIYSKYYAPPQAKYYGGFIEGGSGGTTQGTTPQQQVSSGPTAAQKAQARINKDNELAGINLGRQNLARDITEYEQGFEKTGKDLGTSRDTGYQSNSAYFSSISPDAFQSQIGNYNDKVLQAYNEGMNTVNQNKQKVAGYKTDMENYYNTMQNLINQQYTADIGGYSGTTKAPAPTAPQTQQVTANPTGQAANVAYNIANMIDPEGLYKGKVNSPEDPYGFLRTK